MHICTACICVYIYIIIHTPGDDFLEMNELKLLYPFDALPDMLPRKIATSTQNSSPLTPAFVRLHCDGKDHHAWGLNVLAADFMARRKKSACRPSSVVAFVHRGRVRVRGSRILIMSFNICG